MWRALALLQMPATALAVLAALVMYFFADTIVEVPERPQPGIYSVKRLPDSEFINAASQVVNLINSYQPETARAQFIEARRYLWEPALSEFQNTMMRSDLKTIEETYRSQLFFINNRFVKVERYPENDYVVVRLPGIRYKIIGNKQLNPDRVIYYVRMTTIPNNVHNPYGIVIDNIRVELIPGRG